MEETTITRTSEPVGVQRIAAELLCLGADLRVAVAAYCARNGVTQGQIEERLGLARGSLSAILCKASPTSPSADRVRRLIGYEESSRNLTSGG